MSVGGSIHRQVGEVLENVHSRDNMGCGGKWGCSLSKRNIKVDEQG